MILTMMLMMIFRDPGAMPGGERPWKDSRFPKSQRNVGTPWLMLKISDKRAQCLGQEALLKEILRFLQPEDGPGYPDPLVANQLEQHKTKSASVAVARRARKAPPL